MRKTRLQKVIHMSKYVFWDYLAIVLRLSVTNEEIFKESKDEVAEYDATSSGNETEDEELDPDMVITGEDQGKFNIKDSLDVKRYINRVRLFIMLTKDDHNGFSEPDLEPYPMEEESDEETAGYRQSGKTKRKRIKEPMYIHVLTVTVSLSICKLRRWLVGISLIL